LNDAHLSSPPKIAAIQILQAEDELKTPSQFQFSPITLAILGRHQHFRPRIPDLSENVYHFKTDYYAGQCLPNNTPHHAPKRLKNSDESEPSVNDNCLVEFLGDLDLFPQDNNFDRNDRTSNYVPDSKRSRVKNKLTSALDDFCSVLGDKELDSFFAKYKASRDNSEQLAHPRPRSPSNRPAMIEKMLGTSGFESKLVWTAADLSDEESNSRFDTSLFGQLDSMLELETTPNSQISYELLENAITSFNRGLFLQRRSSTQYSVSPQVEIWTATILCSNQSIQPSN
jgi:hypothetical protein